MRLPRRGISAALCCLGVLTIFAVPTAGVAQTGPNSSDPNLNKSLRPAPRVVTGSPAGMKVMGDVKPEGAFGSSQGATWIAASQFNVKLSGASPASLTYAGNFFFDSTGGSGRYYAQLDVEPGVNIQHLTCVFNDSSADNVGFTWYRYTTNLATGATTAVTLDSFVTTGTPGIGFNFLNPADQTMSTTDGNVLMINHYIAVDITENVSFAGCWAFWNRQVSPAPGVATFNDVPTSHPFFRFVEAMVDAGITGGCGGGNYCPNSGLTRGEMAVFLSAALGLNFQY